MVNYVYFLLSGKCRLIEHMIIQEEECYGYVKYKLFNPENGKNSNIYSRRPSKKADDGSQEKYSVLFFTNKQGRESLRTQTKHIKLENVFLL